MNISVTRDDVVHLLGELSDHTIVEILEVKPSYREVEEVAMRLAQADDVMGELVRPLEGAATRVYDILVRSEGFPEEEGRR